MQTYIALLRGINVGGKTTLPMAGLVSALEASGGQSVRTYIQSGNAVFQSVEMDSVQLVSRLSTEISARFGIQPYILILGLEKLIRAMQNNPFPAAQADPSYLHLGFLASVPLAPDLEKLERLKTPGEQYRLVEDVFYLYAPDGVGSSRLAAGVEKVLGVPMTDRNWRTVEKIRKMTQEIDIIPSL